MRRYRKYLVGYDLDSECVYWNDVGQTWIDPLTLGEARKVLKEFNSLHSKIPVVIYELKPILGDKK